MSDNPTGSAPRTTPAGQIPVSSNNPCPFLRALVANGYVGGHVVPLAQSPKWSDWRAAKPAQRKKTCG